MISDNLYGPDLDGPESVPVPLSPPHPTADQLPGIVNPLRMSVDFAANTQPGVVSVTLGNGVVRMRGAHESQASGTLTLSLRWSGLFRAHGLAIGDELGGGWTIARAETNRIDACRPSLSVQDGEVVLPTVSIVKLEDGRDDDEFTARIWGGEGSSRSAVISGWSRA